MAASVVEPRPAYGARRLERLAAACPLIRGCATIGMDPKVAVPSWRGTNVIAKRLSKPEIKLALATAGLSFITAPANKRRRAGKTGVEATRGAPRAVDRGDSPSSGTGRKAEK